MDFLDTVITITHMNFPIARGRVVDFIKRVSMALAISHRTAKNITVRRAAETILTVNRNKNVNRKNLKPLK